MKICCISHSNIALRQQKFWKEFSKLAEVLVISPKQIGKLQAHNETQGNYELFTDDIIDGQNMQTYYFTPKTFEKIQLFKPDIIYQQNDVGSVQCIISQQWAKMLGAEYVQYCWENVRYPTPEQDLFLKRCDLIIAGSEEAKEIHGANYILPQVGIDYKEFSSIFSEKKYDVLFLGRNDPLKGIEYIKQAYPDTVFMTDIPYDTVPLVLSQTRIFVTYPHENDYWAEQWLSYAVVEAMASGCCVITSDTKSVKSWAKDSPIILVPMHNPEKLKEEIIGLLGNRNRQAELSLECQKFSQQFDNKVIAQKLYKIFETKVI